MTLPSRHLPLDHTAAGLLVDDAPQGAWDTWDDWTCTVSVWVQAPEHLAAASAVVRLVMADVERAASRFRPDSEVMALADGKLHVISPVLIDLVASALVASEATQGAIDPTLGRVLQAWGYASSVPSGRVAAPRIEVARRSTWRDVDLDPASRTLRVPRGVLIDLGATAKAWAADRAADLVVEQLGTACVIGIGGDLAVRCDDDLRLPIDVAESDDSDSVRVLVGAGGVATSSITRRRWSTTGVTAHHVIDPATAAPAVGPWRTATVAAASCTAANHAATAALVKGTAAVRWLDSLGLPARLVSQAGQVVAVGAWPRDEVAA